MRPLVNWEIEAGVLSRVRMLMPDNLADEDISAGVVCERMIFAPAFFYYYKIN
jgi:hypothetical protein